jgi:hypothetical protein
MGSAAENATYKLMNEVLNALHNKLIVAGIFCDPQRHLIVSIIT